MKFSPQQRDQFYDVLFNRRDVRGQFSSTPIPDEVLLRILKAAHHAPSVGFMQPWDFIVVKDLETRRKIKSAFEAANEQGAKQFNSERETQYRRLKLEGIIESPLGICVTCDSDRTGPVVLGRTTNPEMDRYSAVCAIENLWLAARAENLGLGWVSIINHEQLKQILGIPEHIQVIGYLCLGYVTHFKSEPELEQKKWLKRLPLEMVIHEEKWQDRSSEIETAVVDFQDQE